MSVKKRFLFSIGANIVRAVVSLLTGLMVARALGPDAYGDLAYLLSTFLAIRALLDMGASSAFYTFIAQRDRSIGYYAVYFGWLAFQFVFTVTLILLILPSAVIERFWLGQERYLIMLALLATFLQNQVWQTVVHVYEAARETLRIQMASLAIVVTHLVVIAIFIGCNSLSIAAVLWAIAAEYFLASAWLYRCINSLSDNGSLKEAAMPLKAEIRSAISAYIKYCQPMILIALFSFVYEILDRWLLQRFGGASQQGFYQVSSQLSTISLLATTSILSILWKELAEANERGDRTRVTMLYQRTTRVLVCISSFVSCCLAPWADHLVEIFLGSAYQAAWPVFLLMLFYPIHQTLGQINCALFMATGHNRIYMRLTVAGLIVSLPVSYILIAPVDGVQIPGLGLGAIGLALKIVGLNLLFVSIQSWVIARLFRMDFQWRYQLALIPTLLFLGGVCRYVIESFSPYIFPLDVANPKWVASTQVLLGSGIYIGVLLAVFMRVPEIAGISRAELMGFYKKLKSLARGHS